MRNYLFSVLIISFCAQLGAQNYYLVYTQPGVDKLEYQFTEQNSLVYSAYKMKENKKNFFFDTGLESPQQISKIPSDWKDLSSVVANTNLVNTINAHTIKLHVLTPNQNGYAANTVGAARLIENTDQGFYFNDATAEFNFNPANPPVAGQDLSVPRDLADAKAAVFLIDQTSACNSKAYAFKSVPLQACVSEFNALVHPQWGVIRETKGKGENKSFELVRINGSEVCPYINGLTKHAVAALKEAPVQYNAPAVPRAYSTEVVRGKTVADTNFPNEFAPNTDVAKSDEFNSDPCDVIAAPNEYVVRQGDNLNNIARAYNLTVAGLKAMNQMSSDIVFPCTKLIVAINGYAPTPIVQNNNDLTQVPSAYSVAVVKKNPEINSGAPSDENNQLSAYTYQPETTPCNLQVMEGEHLVREGETLGQIAEQYNTNVNAIVELNNLNESEVPPCTILKIPDANPVTTAPTTEAALPTNYSVNVVKKNPETTSKALKDNCNVTPKSNEYVVQSGDNIFLIARKYGIPAHQIISLNKLKSNAIHPCEVLKIANEAKPTTTTAKGVKPVSPKKVKAVVTSKGVKIGGKKSTPKVQHKSTENVAVSPNLIIRKGTGIYVVKKGETVKELCQRNNISDLEFRRINNLSATEDLLAGQVVKTELCNCSSDVGPVPLEYNVKSVKVQPSIVSADENLIADRKYHVVEEHETLYSISKKYSLTVQKLKELNNLTETDIISPKQVLILQ